MKNGYEVISSEVLNNIFVQDRSNFEWPLK